MITLATPLRDTAGLQQKEEVLSVEESKEEVTAGSTDSINNKTIKSIIMDNFVSDNHRLNQEDFFEELPSECPPAKAVYPHNMEVYRVVFGRPAGSSDFFSQRKNSPNKVFNANECIARAVSVFNNIDSAKKLSKIPSFKNSQVAKVILREEDGLILKTGKDNSHYSWWRSKIFDPQTAILI